MDEALSEVSLAAHFLLSGLWMLADREGRLEERPRFIKANVFPYREVDVVPLLSELCAVRRIARYEVDGVAYIEVTNWARDQRPHVREAASTYPGSAQAQPRQCSGTTQVSGPAGDIPASSPPRLLGSSNGIRDLGDGIHASASQEPAVAASAPGGEDLPTAADEDVQEADARPTLVLEAQQASKATRKPSKAEELYSQLESRRESLCDEEGLVFVPSRWPAARINRDLGPPAKARAQDESGPEWLRFKAAWTAFLHDAAAAKLDVPYALGWFWQSRSRYEGQGLRGDS